MVKIADSAKIRATIATFPRDGRLHGCCSSPSDIAVALIRFRLYSYRLSGSSGCFWSHRGRRLATVGTVAKLYAGGGELTDHSSVQASHGSLPAGAPRQYERIRFHTNTRTARPWMKAPIVTIRFNVSHPRCGSYV